jgi:DNA repair protein RecO (recombination protein O)
LVSISTHDDLIYVSPKSGRAVSRDAGAPYHDKLLALPTFLRDDHQVVKPPSSDIRAGFKLTEYFLMRDLFTPRGLPMPEAHHAYLAEISKSN